MASVHVLIFEPDANGDQMDYVRYFIDHLGAAFEQIRFTLLTHADAAAHISCQKLIADFAGLLTVRIAPVVNKHHRLLRALSAFYERQWQNAEMLNHALAEIGPDSVDLVLLPYLETVGLLQLGLRRGAAHGRPWGGLAHNIRFHHAACGIKGSHQPLARLQALFFRRMMRDPSLACLGTTDPYLATVIPDPKLAFCPPPAEVPRLSDTSAARSFYGIRPTSFVVLLFGFIDRRKCLDILLEGATRVAPDVDVTVLLAGAQHPDHVSSVMNGNAARKLRDQGRLVELNCFIDYDRDIDPMNAADVVWVFYERAFVRNSGVLARAGMAQRPVIARNHGLIGRMVQDHHLGMALDTDAPDHIAAVLTTLARDPALRRRMGKNGARVFGPNTPERMVRPIVDAMRRLMAENDRPHR